MSTPPSKNLHTAPITISQAAKLRDILVERGWKFEPRPYTIYFAQKEKLTLAVYEKGPKVVLQGRGTDEFVEFTLEPEIYGEAKQGYEEVHNPAMFQPHFGVDESGKGDFFGPLVIAGVFTNRDIAHSLMAAGIQDSKRIGSDQRIRDLAEIIRETPGVIFNVVSISPEKYNALYAKFANLNKLLAWGHARVIENLLDAHPECPRALSDQFANPALIKRALMTKGKGIELEQRTKAESDVAVAAASILAREKFINWLRDARKTYGKELLRGVSGAVKALAHELVATRGPEVLSLVAKTHFKTASEIAPQLFPRAVLPDR
jgi:ribonuclease HIII